MIQTIGWIILIGFVLLIGIIFEAIKTIILSPFIFFSAALFALTKTNIGKDAESH